MPAELTLAITCLTLVVATIAQRVVGMGFGIIMAPVVATVSGPAAAVLVVNLYAVLACGLMVPRLWRDIDWTRLAWLVPPAVLAGVVGLFAARVADVDVLRVGVGLVALLGVALSVAFSRTTHTVDGPVTRATAGAGIGLLNASVALGAPAITIYAIVSRWAGPTFSATLQPFWVVVSLATLVERQLIAPGGAPDWPWWGWVLAAVATTAGTFAAETVARHVTARAARAAVIVLSLISGVTVTVVGVLGLLGR